MLRRCPVVSHLSESSGNAFAGFSLSYFDADTRFFSRLPALDDLDLLRFGFQDTGAALSLLYDTRDNTILPTSGLLLDLTAWRYDESLGGDYMRIVDNQNLHQCHALNLAERMRDTGWTGSATLTGNNGTDPCP